MAPFRRCHTTPSLVIFDKNAVSAGIKKYPFREMKIFSRENDQFIKRK
jgi:hypothetical protein